MFGFPIYVETLVYIVAIQLKFIAFILLIRLLLIVTPLKDLIAALIKLKVPPEFALSFGVGVSYVPVLMRETTLTMEAQAARGLEWRGRNPIKVLRRIIPIIIPSLMNALRRAQQIAVAIELRGFMYNPSKRTERRILKFTKLDYAVLAVSLIAGVIGVLGSIWVFNWAQDYRLTIRLISWLYEQIVTKLIPLFPWPWK